MDKTGFPKHEVLSAQDTEKVLELYKATKDEFPRIKKGDPSLKNLTVKSGDIIKIIRKSSTAGEALYYRVVID